MGNVVVDKYRDDVQLPETLWERINAITDQIRQRAFSLFERRGGAVGTDLNDWLEAEREVVWSPASELIENDREYRARVALPGFEAKDLELTAIPHALIVQAESSHKHDGGEGDVCFCEFSEKKLFRRLDLVSEIDVDRVAASLDKGILEVTAQKAAQQEMKAAA